MFTAALLMFSLSAIIASLTSLTHDLVDIKTTIFLMSGPLLMIVALALIAAGRSELPPTAVGMGLAGYLLVMFLSILNARYKWAGWPQLLLAWSGAGFFMAALCCGSQRRTSEILLRYFVLMLFIVNIIGFLMFSFPGAPPRSSLLSWFVKWWTGSPSVDPSRFSVLLLTLSLNDGNLMSTFAGADYHACFCLFCFPFALLMALDPGPVRHRALWRLVGLAATATCATTIFYCRYFLLFLIWAIFFLLFSVVFFFAADIPGSRPFSAVANLEVLVLLELRDLRVGFLHYILNSFWAVGQRKAEVLDEDGEVRFGSADHTKADVLAGAPDGRLVRSR
jgi:hypothetical protein